MQRLETYRLGLLASAVAATAASAGSLPATDQGRPLRFFEGRTEMISVVKVVTKKPYRSRTIGQGRILPDGSLALAQTVEEEGKPVRQRYWKIRQVGKDRFAGTMSEAVGPVRIETIKGQYRFKFKMKGNLSVEQWLRPAPDGRWAKSSMIVRKFGVAVASSNGTVRKL